MRDALSRAFFLALARSNLLKAGASRYGMRGPDGFARRFVGGETLNEAMGVVRELDRQGFTHTLNYLGEHVASPDVARSSRVGGAASGPRRHGRWRLAVPGWSWRRGAPRRSRPSRPNCGTRAARPGR